MIGFRDASNGPTDVRCLPKALLPLLFLLLPALVGFGPPTLVESDDVRLPIGPTQLQLLEASRPPAQIGQASLIMDLSSGQVVFQRNARARLAPASTTKVMTAIVALERGDLRRSVTIREEDLVEGSSMGLQVGDTLTVEQLLWGMLIASGNDAAQAIARVVGGGSVARFVEMMNEMARTLHLKDTQFENPHGLDATNHYSSAYDLAEVSRYAFRSPLFARIVASQEYSIQGSRTFTGTTTNQLLLLHALVQGVNGVKTGFTDRSGDSLIASVNRGGHRVLVVVLGSMDRARSAATLIEYAYNHFAWVSLPPPLRSSLSASGRLAASVYTEVMVPAWQRYYVKISIALPSSQKASSFPGPEGLLTYYLGGQELARVPLYPPRG